MENKVLINYTALYELLKIVAYFNATYEDFDDSVYTESVYAHIGRKALEIIDDDSSLNLISKK